MVFTVLISSLLIGNIVYAADDLPAEQPIPENCVVWFDGCNTCQVEVIDEVTGASELLCTKKYCPPELLEEPKCLKYTRDI